MYNKRYQVVYTKTIPCNFWTDYKERAIEFATFLRESGYDVFIWEHTNDGARLTNW